MHEEVRVLAWLPLLRVIKSRVLYHLTDTQLNSFTWRTLVKATPCPVLTSGVIKRENERKKIRKYESNFSLITTLSHLSNIDWIWFKTMARPCLSSLFYVALSVSSWTVVTAAFYSTKHSYITSIPSLYLQSLSWELTKVIKLRKIPMFYDYVLTLKLLHLGLKFTFSL